MLQNHTLKLSQEASLFEVNNPEFPYLKEILTPFGPHVVTENEFFFFPRGLMGFENHQEFALIPLSLLHRSSAHLANNTHYILAFCGPDSRHYIEESPCYPCFFLYNASSESELIDAKDLQIALQSTGLHASSTSPFLLMTFKGKDQQGNPLITLNTKAPLLIDTSTRQGWQQVLHNKKYSLHYPFQQGSEQ